jgi:hypothetical protein
VRRLGPETLSPEHQLLVKRLVKRLCETSGVSDQTIYFDINREFQVGTYSQIPKVRWDEVAAYLVSRIQAAESGQGGTGKPGMPSLWENK